MIQQIHPKLLTRLWRHAGRVEVGHLLLPRGTIGLWESPCGLAFFHPAVEGDGALYPAFYQNVRADHWLMDDAKAGRAEFSEAANLVEPGDRVLDVGCGLGAFGRRVPHASYTGLDPYAPEAAGPSVLRETVFEHAERNPGGYDVVCAFQVLEHSAAPLDLAEAMVRLLRPGGLFIVGVPTWPSPLVEIPNFPANATPHHLSWWNRQALEALSAELGLTPVLVKDLPPQRQHGLIHWMHWLSPVKARGPYFRSAWSWHLSLIFSFMMAMLVGALLPLPPNARSIDCVLAARKPVL